MDAPKLIEIADQYSDLFNTCVPGGRPDGTVHGDRLLDIDQTVDLLMAHMSRYAEVASNHGGMPPVFVGLIHMMEASGDFTQGLYNGDPLTARTVNVPRGKPVQGTPPFTWEFVAIDALRWERAVGDWSGMSAEDWDNWSVAAMCYKLEGYNGWGSRLYHNVPTAYLWAGSNHYTSGKYVRDGIWDGNAVSDEEGAAVLLRRMCQRHLISLPGVAV